MGSAITTGWEDTDRRRCQLIRKDVKGGGLDDAEAAELITLEALADARIALMDLLYPAQPDDIQLTMERLKNEGKWEDEQ